MLSVNRLVLGSITFAFTAVIGCGAGDFSTLFNEGGGNGGAGGAGTTGSTSSSSSATSSSSGSTSSSSGSTTSSSSSSTTSSSSSTTTSSSSTTTSSSSTTTSSSSTTTSSSSSTTSSSSSTGGTVPCGAGLTCPLGGTNACCWNNFGTALPQAECVNAPPDTDGCKTFAATDGYETRIECSRPSDCGSAALCCANRQYTSNGSFYDTVTCTPSCDWPNVILCDGPTFPCPVVQTGGGPVQTTCKQSQLLPPGYLVCGT